MGKKYRRVYAKTAGKIATAIGVPLIVGLFLLLSQRGDITITGYSGDVVCAGTELDPCYAYINFTANTDIYIYPNESWIFSTNPPIKKVILQRRWGNTWRTINLSRPWNSKVKYAVKFSKGKSYQIRFVGYKEDPYDDVKWGFGDIDPIWYGVRQETFFVNDSNNATIKMYRISFNGMTLTTRANTKCYWNASEKYRRCVQDVVIENGLSPTALDFSNFKYSFQTDRMKDMKISFPNILSEGNNTIRFEFLYPPNAGEEWNLSFRYGDYEWKLDPTISGCSDIVSSGDYYLDTDIIDSSTSYCIRISANNVNFYCNGHTIDGDDNADYGIYISRSSNQITNITIRNCNITDWDSANIYLRYANNNTLENIISLSSPDYGIYLYYSHNTTITNSTANSNSYGFYLSSSDSTTITNSTANSNSQAGFHILSSYNTITSITAKENNVDISLQSIEFNVINNATIGSSYYGIYLYQSHFNTITNIVQDSSRYGIYSYSSKSNIINNSIFQNNMNYGIYMYFTGQSPNKIYNCLLNNTYNVYFGGTIYSNYWNTTKQEGERIYSLGNYIGGNYYTNPAGNGFSDTCEDLDQDGFCDSPYDVEHRDTDCSDSSNCDYLPYSNEYSVRVPDLNLSFGPPNTYLFRFGICGPDFENASAVPENQTDTYGIDYLCNNGTVAGDVQVRLSGALNDGWTWYASNTSTTQNLIELTTDWKTIYHDLEPDSCIYIWHVANCSYVTRGPGAYEEYQIV